MNAKRFSKSDMTWNLKATYRGTGKKLTWLISRVSMMAFFTVLSASGSHAISEYKTILNPYTGRFDFVNNISTGTLSLGSAFRTVDSAGCAWDITVDTDGDLHTTLINCPVVASSSQRCQTGQSLGLLLSITCGPTSP